MLVADRSVLTRSGDVIDDHLAPSLPRISDDRAAHAGPRAECRPEDPGLGDGGVGAPHQDRRCPRTEAPALRPHRSLMPWRWSRDMTKSAGTMPIQPPSVNHHGAVVHRERNRYLVRVSPSMGLRTKVHDQSRTARVVAAQLAGR